MALSPSIVAYVKYNLNMAVTNGMFRVQNILKLSTQLRFHYFLTLFTLAYTVC